MVAHQPVAALRGTPAVELALRKLETVGTFMMTTAHPDDENNAMLAYYGHGKGMRTALVTATRGEGGQNEIGPELFEALAVLRTEELLAAHRYDGAEQYFTRAVDLGFSFSVEETLQKWGHDEVLGDFVRLIRTIRPDVMAGLSTTGVGGGQHHQTSARLSLEAFKIAGDPTKYPEQIREGLRPWQPKKIYFMTNFGGPADPHVRHLVHVGPDAGGDRPAGQRRPGGLTDELERRVGGDHPHVVAGLGEQPQQFTGLVGGDAPADAQHDLGHSHDPHLDARSRP